MKKRPPIDGWTPSHVSTVRAAAEQNDTKALTTLGILYRDGLASDRYGQLVTRDARLARRYLERAARNGDPEALCALADTISAHAQSGSVSRAARLYRRAFRTGNATAAYNLACLYQNAGRHALSVRWFRLAKAAGDRTAEFQLALAELYGLGVRRNPIAAARKLETISAKRVVVWPDSAGVDVQAMLILSEELMRGWLLPRDFDASISWLRRAAKRGSLTAKAMLREYEMTTYIKQ
jgi:TPR repeat protein